MIPYTLDQVLADLEAAVREGTWELAQSLGALADDLTAYQPEATCAAAALWFAEVGLHVFPVQAGRKDPYPHTRGCSEATSSTRQIYDWWDKWPTANVGIATGHLIDVIDIDGVVGHAEWGRRYGDNWAGLNLLTTVSTPRPGGLHLYVPATGRRNGAGNLPGIDYRGAGGYVVAPPSHTPAGAYRFLRPLDTRSLTP